jgi:hypothetical protein
LDGISPGAQGRAAKPIYGYKISCRGQHKQPFIGSGRDDQLLLDHLQHIGQGLQGAIFTRFCRAKPVLYKREILRSAYTPNKAKKAEKLNNPAATIKYVI